MAKPKTRVVGSLVEFVQAVDELLDLTRSRNAGISNTHNWYRGIGKGKTNKLLAGLFRVKQSDAASYLNTEAQMMRDFERQLSLQAPSTHTTSGSEPLLKLFHMQHYGVPTRLLDWSTNPLIALYFALSSDAKSQENAAVWVLDPWGWNREILQDNEWHDKGPADASEYIVRRAYTPPSENSYDRIAIEEAATKPIALLGMFNTERMRAQRGVFTMFGKNDRPMEEVYQSEKLSPGILMKIEIDRKFAADIFAKLTAIGYTDSVSYPDFQGVATEIRRTYGYLS